jgi:hypothetical protein
VQKVTPNPSLLIPLLLLLVAPSAMAVELSAEVAYYSECNIASTTTAGNATLTFEVESAGTHDRWRPHFGVVLVDAENNLLYKISVTAATEPLRLVDAQQMFYFATGANEPVHAINLLESFSPPPDGKVEMRLWWQESGLVRVALNGVPTGSLAFSRRHQNWSLFVSGMKIKVEGTGVDFAKCER